MTSAAFSFRRLLGALALGGLAGAPALAADLGYRKPAPPPLLAPFSWTGLYAGLDAGVLRGRSATWNSFTGETQRLSPRGASLGVHLGYRYQFANGLVAGVELRGFANAGTRSSGPGPLAGYTSHLRDEGGGDARLMLGYAFNRVMIYAAGGLAGSQIRGCFAVNAAGVCATADDRTRYRSTRLGYTLGGGLAYALTDRLQLRLDYTYARFPTYRFQTLAFDGDAESIRIKYASHAMRAGLSWRF